MNTRFNLLGPDVYVGPDTCSNPADRHTALKTQQQPLRKTTLFNEARS